MKSTEHRRTRHFNIMLIVLAVVALVAVLAAVDSMPRASRGSHHGWFGHHGNGDVAMAICDRSRDDRVTQLGAYLAPELDLDAAQEAAWDQVARELERGFASLRDVCGRIALQAVPVSMPERLAFMESAMGAGTETLRAVRPAFADFYGMLDEDQQRKTDELLRRHGSGRR